MGLPYTNFLNTPAYQNAVLKARRKLNAMPASEREILKGFAGRAAGKQFAYAQAGYGKKGQEERFAEGKRQFGISHALAEKQFASQENIQRARIALGREGMESRYGIQQRQFQYGEQQRKKEFGPGMANIAVAGVSGYLWMDLYKKYAQQMAQQGKSLYGGPG